MIEWRNWLWWAKTQVEASSKYVREKQHCAWVMKVSHVMVDIKVLYLLKFRPSYLFMLFGCISSWMDYPMSRSMCPALAERNFVSCSLIIRLWSMLFAATADLSVCASRTWLLCSLILIWIDWPLCTIQTLRINIGCCIHAALLIPNIMTGGGWLQIFLGGRAKPLMLWFYSTFDIKKSLMLMAIMWLSGLYHLLHTCHVGLYILEWHCRMHRIC